MAAIYIDSTYVDGYLGTDRRQALFNDGSGYVSTYFDQLVLSASDLVKAAALNAGYTLGDTTTSQTVKTATFGAFLMLAYGRKDQPVPEQYATTVNLIEAIRTGAVPLPGVEPDGATAIGGADFTETSTSISSADGSRPQVFSRSNQDLY